MSDKQGAVEKIKKWQDQRTFWAHYNRASIRGHFATESDSYAEQNHASLKAIAGDDPCRSLEQNIVDVMHRTGNRFNELQVEKDNWAVNCQSDIDLLSGKRKQHLTEPRKILDSHPYSLFVEQYDLYPRYNVSQEVRHTSICVTSN